jgi:hypothetical protein
VANIPLPPRSQAPEALPLARIPTASYDHGPGIRRVAAVAADAYMQPPLPADMFRGDFIKGQAWGEAAQTFGQAMLAIAEDTARAKDEGDLAQLDLDTSEALASYELGLADQPDQSRWAEGWRKTIQKLRNDVGKRSLSPRAARAADLRIKRTEMEGNIRMQHLAQKQERHRATIALDTLEDQLIKNRQFDAALQVGQRKTDANLQFPEEQEARAYEIKSMAEVDSLYRLIDANPKTARQDLDAKNADGSYVRFPWLDERNRESARSYSDRVLHDRQSHILQEIREHADSGKPLFPDDVDAFDPSGYLNADQKDDVRKYVAGLIPKNGKADFEEAIAVIDTYKAEDDPTGYGFATMQYAIDTAFTDAFKDKLTERLKKRSDKTISEAIPMGEVTALLDKWKSEEKFGAYQKQVRAADGSPLVSKDPKRYTETTSPTWGARLFMLSGGKWGKPGVKHSQDEAPDTFSPVMETDKVAEARIADTIKAIREKVEAKRDAGEFKTIDDALSYAAEEAVKAGAKVKYSPKPRQPEPPNPLLPPITAEQAAENARKALQNNARNF